MFSVKIKIDRVNTDEAEILGGKVEAASCGDLVGGHEMIERI